MEEGTPENLNMSAEGARLITVESLRQKDGAGEYNMKKSANLKISGATK